MAFNYQTHFLFYMSSLDGGKLGGNLNLPEIPPILLGSVRGRVDEIHRALNNLMPTLEKLPDDNFAYSPEHFPFLLKVLQALNHYLDSAGNRRREKLLRRIETAILGSVGIDVQLLGDSHLGIDNIEAPTYFAFTAFSVEDGKEYAVDHIFDGHPTVRTRRMRR